MLLYHSCVCVCMCVCALILLSFFFPNTLWFCLFNLSLTVYSHFDIPWFKEFGMTTQIWAESQELPLNLEKDIWFEAHKTKWTLLFISCSFWILPFHLTLVEMYVQVKFLCTINYYILHGACLFLVRNQASWYCMMIHSWIQHLLRIKWTIYHQNVIYIVLHHNNPPTATAGWFVELIL